MKRAAPKRLYLHMSCIYTRTMSTHEPYLHTNRVCINTTRRGKRCEKWARDTRCWRYVDSCFNGIVQVTVANGIWQEDSADDSYLLRNPEPHRICGRGTRSTTAKPY